MIKEKNGTKKKKGKIKNAGKYFPEQILMTWPKSSKLSQA